MRRRPRDRWAGLTAAAVAAVVTAASPAVAAPSATGVTVSPAAAMVGTPVELTATVTCASDPSGGLGMTFFDGADLLGTVPVAVNGQAHYTASFGALGPHTITAAYNGNDSCDASSATAAVSVLASPVTPLAPPGLCLLACGGLIGFVVGDIHNNISIG